MWVTVIIHQFIAQKVSFTWYPKPYVIIFCLWHSGHQGMSCVSNVTQVEVVEHKPKRVHIEILNNKRVPACFLQFRTEQTSSVWDIQITGNSHHKSPLKKSLLAPRTILWQGMERPWQCRVKSTKEPPCHASYSYGLWGFNRDVQVHTGCFFRLVCPRND